MGVRPILLFPNPTLNKACSKAIVGSNNLNSVIKDLTDTLYSSPGVGLAAPQIGIKQQVSVIHVKHRKKKGSSSKQVSGLGGKLVCLINPTLVLGRGTQVPREGCLSVPDWLANVSRFNEVVVETDTTQGKRRRIRASGFEALALQHEIDHLNGILFLDRVSNLKTDMFRRKTY